VTSLISYYHVVKFPQFYIILVLILLLQENVFSQGNITFTYIMFISSDNVTQICSKYSAAFEAALVLTMARKS